MMGSEGKETGSGVEVSGGDALSDEVGSLKEEMERLQQVIQASQEALRDQKQSSFTSSNPEGSPRISTRSLEYDTASNFDVLTRSTSVITSSMVPTDSHVGTATNSGNWQHLLRSASQAGSCISCKKLRTANSSLEEEVASLKEQLEHAHKHIKAMNKLQLELQARKPNLERLIKAALEQDHLEREESHRAALEQLAQKELQIKHLREESEAAWMAQREAQDKQEVAEAQLRSTEEALRVCVQEKERLMEQCVELESERASGYDHHIKQATAAGGAGEQGAKDTTGTPSQIPQKACSPRQSDPQPDSSTVSRQNTRDALLSETEGIQATDTDCCGNGDSTARNSESGSNTLQAEVVHVRLGPTDPDPKPVDATAQKLQQQQQQPPEPDADCHQDQQPEVPAEAVLAVEMLQWQLLESLRERQRMEKLHQQLQADMQNRVSKLQQQVRLAKSENEVKVRSLELAVKKLSREGDMHKQLSAALSEVSELHTQQSRLQAELEEAGQQLEESKTDAHKLRQQLSDYSLLEKQIQALKAHKLNPQSSGSRFLDMFNTSSGGSEGELAVSDVLALYMHQQHKLAVMAEKLHTSQMQPKGGQRTKGADSQPGWMSGALMSSSGRVNLMSYQQSTFLCDAEVTNLREQKQLGDIEIARLEQQISEMKRLIAKTEMQLSRQEHLTQQQQDVAAQKLQQAEAEWTAAIQAASKQCAEADEAASAAKMAQQQSEEQVKRLQKELEKVKAELQEAVTQMDSVSNKAEQDVAEADQQRQRAEHDVKERCKQIEVLMQALEATQAGDEGEQQQAVVTLTVQLLNAQTENSSLEWRITELLTQLQESQQELESAKAEIGGLQAQLVQQHIQLEGQIATEAASQERIQQLCGERQQVQKLLQQQSLELDSAQRSLALCQAECQTLRTALHAAHGQQTEQIQRERMEFTSALRRAKTQQGGVGLWHPDTRLDSTSSRLGRAVEDLLSWCKSIRDSAAVQGAVVVDGPTWSMELLQKFKVILLEADRLRHAAETDAHISHVHAAHLLSRLAAVESSNRQKDTECQIAISSYQALLRQHSQEASTALIHCKEQQEMQAAALDRAHQDLHRCARRQAELRAETEAAKQAMEDSLVREQALSQQMHELRHELEAYRTSLAAANMNEIGWPQVVPGQSMSALTEARNSAVVEWVEERVLLALQAHNHVPDEQVIALMREICALKLVQGQLLARIAGAGRIADAATATAQALQAKLHALQPSLQLTGVKSKQAAQIVVATITGCIHKGEADLLAQLNSKSDEIHRLQQQLLDARQALQSKELAMQEVVVAKCSLSVSLQQAQQECSLALQHQAQRMEAAHSAQQEVLNQELQQAVRQLAVAQEELAVATAPVGRKLTPSARKALQRQLLDFKQSGRSSMHALFPLDHADVAQMHDDEDDEDAAKDKHKVHDLEQHVAELEARSKQLQLDVDVREATLAGLDHLIQRADLTTTTGSPGRGPKRQAGEKQAMRRTASVVSSGRAAEESKAAKRTDSLSPRPYATDCPSPMPAGGVADPDDSALVATLTKELMRMNTAQAEAQCKLKQHEKSELDLRQKLAAKDKKIAFLKQHLVKVLQAADNNTNTSRSQTLLSSSASGPLITATNCTKCAALEAANEHLQQQQQQLVQLVKVLETRCQTTNPANSHAEPLLTQQHPHPHHTTYTVSLDTKAAPHNSVLQPANHTLNVLHVMQSNRGMALSPGRSKPSPASPGSHLSACTAAIPDNSGALLLHEGLLKGVAVTALQHLQHAVAVIQAQAGDLPDLQTWLDGVIKEADGEDVVDWEDQLRLPLTKAAQAGIQKRASHLARTLLDSVQALLLQRNQLQNERAHLQELLEQHDELTHTTRIQTESKQSTARNSPKKQPSVDQQPQRQQQLKSLLQALEQHVVSAHSSLASLASMMNTAVSRNTAPQATHCLATIASDLAGLKSSVSLLTNQVLGLVDGSCSLPVNPAAQGQGYCAPENAVGVHGSASHFKFDMNASTAGEQGAVPRVSESSSHGSGDDEKKKEKWKGRCLQLKQRFEAAHQVWQGKESVWKERTAALEGQISELCAKHAMEVAQLQAALTAASTAQQELASAALKAIDLPVETHTYHPDGSCETQTLHASVQCQTGDPQTTDVRKSQSLSRPHSPVPYSQQNSTDNMGRSHSADPRSSPTSSSAFAKFKQLYTAVNANDPEQQRLLSSIPEDPSLSPTSRLALAKFKQLWAATKKVDAQTESRSGGNGAVAGGEFDVPQGPADELKAVQRHMAHMAAEKDELVKRIVTCEQHNQVLHKTVIDFQRYTAALHAVLAWMDGQLQTKERRCVHIHDKMDQALREMQEKLDSIGLSDGEQLAAQVLTIEAEAGAIQLRLQMQADQSDWKKKSTLLESQVKQLQHQLEQTRLHSTGEIQRLNQRHASVCQELEGQIEQQGLQMQVWQQQVEAAKTAAQARIQQLEASLANQQRAQEQLKSSCAHQLDAVRSQFLQYQQQKTTEIMALETRLTELILQHGQQMQHNWSAKPLDPLLCSSPVRQPGSPGKRGALQRSQASSPSKSMRASSESAASQGVNHNARRRVVRGVGHRLQGAARSFDMFMVEHDNNLQHQMVEARGQFMDVAGELAACRSEEALQSVQRCLKLEQLQREQAQQAAAALQEEVDDLRGRMLQSRKQIQEMEASGQSAMADLAAAKAELEKLHEELSSTKQALKSSKAEVARQHRTLQQLQADTSGKEAVRQLDEAKAAKDAAEQRAQQLRGMLNRKNEFVRALEKQIEELKAGKSAEAQAAANQEGSTPARDSLNSLNSRLRSQLQRKEADLAAASQQLEQERAQAANTKRELVSKMTQEFKSREDIHVKHAAMMTEYLWVLMHTVQALGQLLLRCLGCVQGATEQLNSVMKARVTAAAASAHVESGLGSDGIAQLVNMSAREVEDLLGGCEDAAVHPNVNRRHIRIVVLELMASLENSVKLAASEQKTTRSATGASMVAGAGERAILESSENLLHRLESSISQADAALHEALLALVS